MDPIREISDTLGNLSKRIRKLETKDNSGSSVGPVPIDWSKITLIHYSGVPTETFPKTDAGLDLAIAAADVSGDKIYIPAGTYGADHAVVGKGISFYGEPCNHDDYSFLTKLYGQITLSTSGDSLNFYFESIEFGVTGNSPTWIQNFLLTSLSAPMTQIAIVLYNCYIWTYNSDVATGDSACVYSQGLGAYGDSGLHAMITMDNVKTNPGKNIADWNGYFFYASSVNSSGYVITTDCYLEGLITNRNSGPTVVFKPFDCVLMHCADSIAGVWKIFNLQGDRSAWNVMDPVYDSYHADDIHLSTLRRHLPLPGSFGNIPYDDGTNWTSEKLTDVISPLIDDLTNAQLTINLISGLSPIVYFPATDVGLDSAFLAAVDGDLILLPGVVFASDHTFSLDKSVTIIGKTSGLWSEESWKTESTGSWSFVLGDANPHEIHLENIYWNIQGNSAGDLFAVKIYGDTDTWTYLFLKNCFLLTYNAGAGRCFNVYASSAGTPSIKLNLRAEGSLFDNDGNPDGFFAYADANPILYGFYYNCDIYGVCNFEYSARSVTGTFQNCTTYEVDHWVIPVDLTTVMFYSDRSSWWINGFNDKYHAQDIQASSFTRHLPLPATVGGVPVANGTNWDIQTTTVTGPASSTDNAIVRFDLATGKIIQNSLSTLDDAGSVNIPVNQSYKINSRQMLSSRKGANSDGDNIWVGNGGQSSIGEIGATYKGSDNTSVGEYALFSITTGMNNVAIGAHALQSEQTGNDNIAVGYAALSQAAGSHNVAVGSASLAACTTGNGNVAVGAQALQSNVSGENNVAIGTTALFDNTARYNNTAVGYVALMHAIGDANTAIGSDAGSLLVSGTYNTFLGYAAGAGVSQKTNATNSTAIGNSANTTKSNQVVIGNTSVTEISFGNGAIFSATGLNIPGGQTYNIAGSPHSHASTSAGPGALGNGSAQYQTIITGATPFAPAYSGFLLDGTTGGKTQLAVTSGKVLTLTAADDYNLTVPATGTALVKSGALTTGYIPFGIAGSLAGEDSNLFWDNTNKRLGVGTTTPEARVEINTGAQRTIFINNAPSGTTYNVISMNGTAGEGTAIGFTAGATGDESLYIESGNGGNINFRTGNGSAYSQKATILANGNFGIDVENPLYKMQVNGSVNATSFIIPWNTTNLIHMPLSSADDSYDLGILVSSATRELNIFAKSAASDGKITFSTGAAPTEWMRITNGGLVIIGATTGAGKLTVVGTSDIAQTIVKGHSTQTANNFELQDSDGHIHVTLNEAAASGTAKENVFNETGDALLDFRVESDTEENMFLLDANGETDGLLWFGGTTNGISIAKGGEMVFNGTATVWEDIQFPIAAGKVPAANAPNWETFTTNTSEYAFDVDEYIDTQAGEPAHGWKEGSTADAHLHITTKAAQSSGADRFAKFTVWISLADPDGVWTELSPFTLEKTIPTGTAALTHYLLDLGDATLTGYHVGMQLKCRAKRIAATGGTEYASSMFITQVGMHHELSGVGSKTETGR